MEIETVMSYIANSVNPDGVRAQEIVESLNAGHPGGARARPAVRARIKELYGVVPGSLEFTAEQSYLQPPEQQTDIVHVIKGVIEAETGAIEHYNRSSRRPRDRPGHERHGHRDPPRRGGPPPALRGLPARVRGRGARLMPPRGVKKGTKRERQYEAIKDSREGARRLGVARRGDRGAHRQQGARPRRRVAHRLAHLDAGHLLRPPRRAAARTRAAPAGARASSSTTRPRTLGVDGRSKMNKAAAAAGRRRTRSARRVVRRRVPRAVADAVLRTEGRAVAGGARTGRASRSRRRRERCARGCAVVPTRRELATAVIVGDMSARGETAAAARGADVARPPFGGRALSSPVSGAPGGSIGSSRGASGSGGGGSTGSGASAARGPGRPAPDRGRRAAPGVAGSGSGTTAARARPASAPRPAAGPRARALTRSCAPGSRLPRPWRRRARARRRAPPWPRPCAPRARPRGAARDRRRGRPAAFLKRPLILSMMLIARRYPSGVSPSRSA